MNVTRDDTQTVLSARDSDDRIKRALAIVTVTGFAPLTTASLLLPESRGFLLLVLSIEQKTKRSFTNEINHVVNHSEAQNVDK